MHHDIGAIERMEIIRDLRMGEFDVLVGINLLREGLDIPEVALVAILDADKEGFLRSARSLTQTAGRAARNVNGRVIMYADTITDSMKATIDETNRHRRVQMQYNKEHNITPKQVKKANTLILSKNNNPSDQPVEKFMSKQDLERAISKTKSEMEKAAKKLDFVLAAKLRDKMFDLQALLKK